MLTQQIEETAQKHAGTIRKFARQADVILTVAPLLADDVQGLLNDAKRSEHEHSAKIAAKDAEIASLKAKIGELENALVAALTPPKAKKARRKLATV